MQGDCANISRKIARLERQGKNMEKSSEQSEERLVEVHVAEDLFEAEILMHALEREGILGVCKTHEEIAYDGLFVLQRGWGSILVSVQQADRAREIIQEAMEAYGRGVRPEGRAPGPDSAK